MQRENKKNKKQAKKAKKAKQAAAEKNQQQSGGGAADSASAAYLAGRPFLIGRGREGEEDEDEGDEAAAAAAAAAAEEEDEEEGRPAARVAAAELGLLAFAAHLRCEACALVVEEVSAALREEVAAGQRALQAGQRKEAEFDVKQTVAAVCARYASAAEEDARRRKVAAAKEEEGVGGGGGGAGALPPLSLAAPLSRACAEIVSTPRLVDAFARAFSGDPPLPSNVYARRGAVCGALSASCAPPPAALAPQVSGCEACRLVVRDAVGQLRRRSATGAVAVRSAKRRGSSLGGGAGGRKQLAPAAAARKAEAWTVLEGLCASAEARHPRKIAAIVTEQCEELLEDAEAAIGDALVRRLLAPAAKKDGGEGKGKGKGKGGAGAKAAAAREASAALAAALALEHEVCVVATGRCKAAPGASAHEEL